MSDEFDRFREAMAERTREAQQAGARPPLADDAFLHAMARVKLQPGQMLLLGPRSVAILSQPGTGKVRLPDMYILDRSEWAVVKKGSSHRSVGLDKQVGGSATKGIT